MFYSLKKFYFALLCCLPAFSSTSTTQQSNQAICSSSLSMRNLTGEFIIAGLFPLNYHNTKKSKFVRNNVAITWVEAFVFALRSINKSQQILRNITLGYDIRNSCNEEDIALRNMLDFRLDKSLLDQRNSRITKDSSGCICGAGRNRILAVVGGASSSISTSVSNVLSVDNLPQISYSSTSQALSNKEKYPNFLRTLPPDNYQAKAIAEMLKFFGWTYVNVLASDDDYGRLGFFGLDRELKQRSMCVSGVKIFKRKLPTAQLNEIIDILKRGQSKRANVVVLWCQINEAKIILEEAWKRGLRNLTWIGCETLGTNIDLFELGEIVNGFLGLKPTLSKVSKFEEYLSRLQPKTLLHENPWLELYWKAMPNCTASNASTGQIKYCESLKTGKNLPRSKYSHVISAVYAIALGLQRILDGGKFTQRRDLSSITPSALLQEIKKVKFMDSESNIRISFDQAGDPNFASYTFTNIQPASGKKSYRFIKIGEWEGETGRIIMNKSIIVFPNKQNRVVSQCSMPCVPGNYKVPGSLPCCWTCIPCKEKTANVNSNASFCPACPDNSISNTNRTTCLKLSEIFIFKGKNRAIFVAILSASSLAVVCLSFVVYLFIKHWNTPVVKSSNRELSLIQLGSLMLSLWYPFFYWLEPSSLFCRVASVWLSLFTTIVIAIVLVKTYRLLRIFNKETTTESKILQNKYQSLFVAGFVLVQAAIVVIWLSYNDLDVTKTINKKDRTFVSHCCKSSGTLLVIEQSYILLMSLASAFMAFRARNLPDAFNEARYISFATFIYCLTWVCAIPLYASLDVIAQRHVICATNTIGNIALLLCLYAYKIRIILFMPEKNTRKFFTTQATVNHFQRNRTFSSSISSLPTISLNHVSLQSNSAGNSPQTKHISWISSGSFTVRSAQFRVKENRNKSQSPRDILNAKRGRERSITID